MVETGFAVPEDRWEGRPELLKFISERVGSLLAVPRDKPELVKAQFHVFSRQVPMMYGVVLVNAWALTVVSWGSAPRWLTLYVPIVFSAICLLRLMSWWKSRNKSPSAELARNALIRTNVLAAVMALSITTWALSLSRFSSQEVDSIIAFFLGITGVSVVICLLHLRSAAFIVAIGANFPFIAMYSLSDSPSHVAMAFIMLVVVVSLIVVVFVQSGHFASSVEAQTKLEIANRENFRLANLDSLTDLSNRRQFFSHLEDMFAAARSKGTRLAVGVLDLDGFKPVNDVYGHAVGDTLLTEVGKRLEAFASETMLVARLGGDEFALIFPECGSNDQVLAQGERICAQLRAPFVMPEATIRITGSLGLAIYPDTATSAQDLYEKADYALYSSKRESRSRAMLFSSKHVLQIEQSTRIERVLREADLARELAVHFQPIVDSRTGHAVAFEALARWTSPVLGRVSPALFIPVAERAGLIQKLTRVLLEKALTAAEQWPDEVRLSFNLSTHDISSSEGIVRILGIINASAIDPKRIDLEITETAMMYDFDQAKAAIELLRQLGCGIALDDFGTGFSSLSQLHALPLTKIKIDRSFVSCIDTSSASHKIVKSLLTLSRDMGLDCVIEGVEKKEELAVLEKLGGWLIQGYFYAPPVPETDVSRFFPQRQPAEQAI